MFYGCFFGVEYSFDGYMGGVVLGTMRFGVFENVATFTRFVGVVGL